MPKILLVDDSSAFRAQMVRLFSKFAVELVEAEDGVQGLQRLSENPDVKLVLSDFNMPNMNGLEMIGEIRKSTQNAGLGIVVLTSVGKDSKDLVNKAKELGVIAWIVKNPTDKHIEQLLVKCFGEGVKIAS